MHMAHMQLIPRQLLRMINVVESLARHTAWYITLGTYLECPLMKAGGGGGGGGGQLLHTLVRDKAYTVVTIIIHRYVRSDSSNTMFARILGEIGFALGDILNS